MPFRNITRRSFSRSDCLYLSKKVTTLSIVLGTLLTNNLGLTYSTSVIKKPYRILVIHGKGNSGDLYRSKLLPLIESHQFKNCEFLFPNAPFQMITDGDSAPNQYEWWKLGKGERSFTAKNYEGIQTSIELIESFKSIDAVIGHSQGAILLSILLARGLLGHSSFLPSKTILSGAAWPNPYSDFLEQIENMNDSEKLILIKKSNLEKTLHVIGEIDDINPPEMAKRICRIFGGELKIHSGGHFLPIDEASIQGYANFLNLPNDKL